MSTAALFVEAVDTAVTLARAELVWWLLLAVVATVALFTVVAAVTAPVEAARKTLSASLAASRAVRALREQPDRYTPRQGPSWARHEIEEAA